MAVPYAQGGRQPYPIGDLENGQIIQANTPLPTKTPDTQWIGYESITVSTTAVALAASNAGYLSADFAMLTVESNPISFTLDGRTPTSTIGHAAAVGSKIDLENNWEINNFQMIRSGGADATVKVSYGQYV